MLGYLDIETSFQGDITVVGLLRPDGEFVQLVAPDVDRDRVLECLDGLDTLCTYGGEFFDLPVLGRAVGLSMLTAYRSLDLHALCRLAGTRGGLKAVEERYGIRRRHPGLTGLDAMLLWQRWENGDGEALQTLLAYNRDDVVNLALLERRLRGDLETPVIRPASVPNSARVTR